MDDGLIKYTSKADPFSYVVFHTEEEFVSIGEIEPTDAELISMAKWEDVEGWEAY